jgi:hypothetical protein
MAVSKRLLIGLASSVAAVAVSVAPAPAQATPQFRINGALAGTGKQNAVVSGSTTIDNALLGEIKCDVLESLQVWNESGKGLAETDGYTTYGCTAAPPCNGVFATAEMPIEVTERENPKTKELEKVARRGPSTLPWLGEAIEEEGTEKFRRLKTNAVKLTIVAPCFDLEFPFEEVSEPKIVNGAKSGLKPTHLEFENQGGPIVCEGKCRPVNGRLAMAGGMSQLITAE